VETLSGEPEHPGFHRGRFEDQRLFELLRDYDLGGGLSPDWRKRVEKDDYEIGWPEGLIRSVRLPNGESPIEPSSHPSATGFIQHSSVSPSDP
jgi:hypothetical protein